MNGIENNEIENQVLGRLACYGKIGLLIEDAPDAKLRTAREIYAADGLPRWWLHCEDVESGGDAVGALARAVLDGEPSWARGLPAVLVADRYLKTTRSSNQVVPWDDQKRGCPAMIDTVTRLQSSGAVAVATVTSYFNPQGTPSGIHWQPRHHEPLFQLRRKMKPALLAFGPAEEAAVQSRLSAPAGLNEEELDEAACRSRLWASALEDLAAAFRPDSACIRILFTGAGASFANHPLAPGIPPTWFLLDWASWCVCNWEGQSMREPTWPLSSAEEKASQSNVLHGSVRTIQALLDNFIEKRSARQLQWTLEELFRDSRDNRSRLDDFVNAFRQALQRYDHDFPYHTWLLGQLPWTLIATTNFDSFHERAASSAASTLEDPDASEKARRLGDVLDDTYTKAARRSRDPIPRAGLFKPYGSLMRIGPLALTKENFWDLSEPFEKVLDSIIAGSRDAAWLVVVGQSLASDALTAMLERLLQRHRQREIRVFWVDPSCCRLNRHPNANARFLERFEDVLRSGVLPAGNHRVYPLPAQALDFAYDLWGRWKRRQR
jgi:hypothetical protein